MAVNASPIAQYKAQILSAASKYHVDPVILGSIILHESGGKAGIVNPQGGASGLTQVLPSAHPEFDVNKLRGTSASDIQYQIDAGAQVLARAMAAHPGNNTAALADYAGGDLNGQTFLSILQKDYTGPVSSVLGVDGGAFLKQLTGILSPLNPYTGSLNPTSGAASGAAGVIRNVQDAASGAQQAAQTFGNTVSWFSQPDNWLRIMIGVVGVAMVIGGLLSVAGSNPTVQEAATAAAVA
jgi:hypothetical protein